MLLVQDSVVNGTMNGLVLYPDFLGPSNAPESGQ